MKKSISLLLVIMTLLCLGPVKARAATMESKAGAVTTNSGSLNVRSAASTTSPVVGTLRKGSHITLISKSGSWWKVEYEKDRYGYCHADYITIIQGSPAKVATQSGNLNVRSGAGTAYSVQARLAKGEAVLLLSSNGGWSRILYHGTKTGYVSTQYLSAGTSASGYSAINLRIPSFKQNDSRWANVKIGTSGKTMAQIGCATTAIAMMESYRTGTTIYPNAMAQKLRYTSTGSVYWPSNFVTVTNSSGYLSAIYQQLKQGKPVLLGAKNANGGQHWVVITGFTGGSLTAANFTINDPGSNSRITLQQFLNVYPTFYKYFYYQ